MAERFTKRLGAEFTGGGYTYKGFVSNVSETGLFIRTKRSYKEGSPIDIKITLPDGKVSCIKGVVNRAVTDELGLSAKNGMGIEITHKDDNYVSFLRGFGGFAGGAGEKPAPERKHYNEEKPGVVVLCCPACGAGNRVPAAVVSLGLIKCGKCRSPLSSEEGSGPKQETGGAKVMVISCAACGAKNRVRSDELHLGPRCGGCREPLPTG